MAEDVPISVVETPEFQSVTSRFMSDDERTALVEHIAYNPLAGDLIPGTGGIRKLRWALEGRGKRSGARIIYFFHNVQMPIFLLTGYAKNERADLSQQDRNVLRQLTEALIEAFDRERS